jgi:hypothetical protein
MYPTSLAVLSVAVLVAVAPVAARADDPIDLEHARALARAGWAMGSYDAELLSRWGCTSGTHSPYCPHYGHHYRARRHVSRY